MLRRERLQLKAPLRRMGGAGIYQYGAGTTSYGGGIYQYGTGTTSYGGGITPYGGMCRGIPLRRMGGAGIKDLFSKGIKAVKKYFKKEGPALAKAVASTAAEAATGLLSGKSVKEVGTQVADKAAQAAIKKLPGMAQPIAESAYSKGKKKVLGGTQPLRPAKGELSASQLKYLKDRADRRPSDKPPVFDRHELQMFGNIIQGKQIIGGGMKKM